MKIKKITERYGIKTKCYECQKIIQPKETIYVIVSKKDYHIICEKCFKNKYEVKK